jgi:hypothetical protein
MAARGEDEAAKSAYLELLRRDPTHFSALNELATLVYAGGFRSAARTAYLQAVTHHPGSKIARVNLANLLREENDSDGATLHYQAALAIDPDMPEAHQGMAWALRDIDPARAHEHWQKGFTGHAVVFKPYRGTGNGVPLLMLVSARGGNIPTQSWISDRQFAVTALFAEFYDASVPLPAHAVILNAIGDADLCDTALLRAEEIVARSSAPVINLPARVRLTGRAQNSRRLGGIEHVIAPRIDARSPAGLLADDHLRFPLLLRKPGFHTGQHFVRVESRDGLADAIAALGGDELLVIEYLDARGPDDMARKYRVMFIDGKLYALHLAVSAQWKVHYFTADMRDNADYREEERRFLVDMAAVLGTRAMAALERIAATLGLEFGGIDFALTPDGSVLLFEANATMVVFAPDADSKWDYRRRSIGDAAAAATQMLLSRVDAATQAPAQARAEDYRSR